MECVDRTLDMAMGWMQGVGLGAVFAGRRVWNWGCRLVGYRLASLSQLISVSGPSMRVSALFVSFI